MAAKKSKTPKKAASAKKKPAAAKKAAVARKKPAAAKKAAATKKAAASKKKPAAAKKSGAQPELARLLGAADSLEESLLDMDPDDPDLDLMLEDLEQFLREALQLDPGNAAIMIRLGEFFLDRNGAEDLALEYFEQALTLQPGDKKLAKQIAKAKAQLAENAD